MANRLLGRGWRMRCSVVIAVLALGNASAATVTFAQGHPPVSWSDASAFVGRTVIVEGPVACVGYSDGIGYINLGLCFPDPGRMTIAIPVGYRDVFADALGRDPLEAVEGLTIQVSGVVEFYRGNEPIIWLRNPYELSIVREPAASRIPIIVDDDGSPDGVLALLYFLAHPGYRVVAATVSVGIARPREFAPNIARLLTLVGRTDVIVAAGRETPLSGSNVFPNPWRDSAAGFWGLSLPRAQIAVDSRSAADVIVDVVSHSPEPVAMFVSGSHTNLAEALRKKPEIAGNIDHVSIMGGAVYVQGNIHHDWPPYPNDVAEWNIWVDPIAFDEVLASGLELRMAPLDATNLVPWTDADLGALQRASGTLAGVAYELFEIMLPLRYVWDVVAAAALEDAHCCTLVPLCVDVSTIGKADEGATRPCVGPQNVLVCLDPVEVCVRTSILDALTSY